MRGKGFDEVHLLRFKGRDELFFRMGVFADVKDQRICDGEGGNGRDSHLTISVFKEEQDVDKPFSMSAEGMRDRPRGEVP